MIKTLTIGNVELPNRYVLAPMAGVTDLPFRLLCKEQGAGLLCMEMISAKALRYKNKNTKALLAIDPREYPVSLQLFGEDPDIISEQAKRIEELPFQILDINMGCPVPKVVRNGEGSALMKDPKRIYDIVYKTARAIKKPVTIKIRKGFDDTCINAPEVAKIAEEAGACAVMALERIPADIRAAGGVSRMSDPKMIRGIQEAVSIPVMAKCRIGHFVEAQILEAIEIDYIDESEVLSPADDIYHINKKEFKVPFVCGARDLGEALRRIAEGASMIRTKGEPGTGDVVQAVRHMRAMNAEIRRIQNLRADELFEAAKQLQVPVDLVEYVHENGKLPVVNFAAGGVATPADAALMMQLGAEGVFVGSGIFKSGNPAKRAASIVKAVTNYTDAKLIAELSTDLGEAMVGINEQEIELLMAERGK